MATTDLYTTVRNTSGYTRVFSFLGPRGVTLPAGGDYQLLGGLITGAMSDRESAAAVTALRTGALTVVDSPNHYTVDGQTGAVKTVKFTNGAIAVADPSFGPYIAYPGYTSVTPASGATGVATSATVVVVFSEAIVPASTTITLVRHSGLVNVPGTSSYNSGTKTLTFTPGSALTSANQYDATVASADAGGHTFTASWSFNT